MTATPPDYYAYVLGLLYAAGFVDDGETREETVRVPTKRAPVGGRGGSGGGELRTFGGRQRLMLPGTNVRATVGMRTTNLYRVDRGRCEFLANLQTSEHEELVKAISKLDEQLERER